MSTARSLQSFVNSATLRSAETVITVLKGQGLVWSPLGDGSVMRAGPNDPAVWVALTDFPPLGSGQAAGLGDRAYARAGGPILAPFPVNNDANGDFINPPGFPQAGFYLISGGAIEAVAFQGDFFLMGINFDAITTL